MTVATSTALAEPQARVLNVLFDQTNASRHGTPTGHCRFGTLASHADLPNRETLYGLVRSGLIRMRDSLTTADIDPDDASEDRIINSLLNLTVAGTGWVEDNPRNALLRKVNTSPLGRVTIRRALEVIPFGSGVRDLIAEGYVSLHTTGDRLEVPTYLIHRIIRHHSDAYILLPTPKIRKVLG